MSISDIFKGIGVKERKDRSEITNTYFKTIWEANYSYDATIVKEIPDATFVSKQKGEEHNAYN